MNIELDLVSIIQTLIVPMLGVIGWYMRNLLKKVEYSISEEKAKELIEGKIIPVVSKMETTEDRLDRIESKMDRVEDKLDRLKEIILKNNNGF